MKIINRTNLLFLIIAVLSIALLISTKSCSNNKENYKGEVELNKVLNDSFAYNKKVWVDNNNKQHTSIEQHNLPSKQFQEYTQPKAKEINIKAKQLEEVTDIKLIIDSSTVDTLSFAKYWKRKNIFAPKEQYIDFSNSNHTVSVEGARSVQLTYKEPRFIIGPSLQVGYWGKLHVYPGVSIIYYPFSIKIK